MAARCNLRCEYCYNHWERQGATRPAEMRTPRAKLALAAIARAPGARGVTLTGGEPLLRPDLPQLVEEARRLGLAVAIATNGSLLSKETVARLAQAGVGHFDISLPTVDSSVYAKLCGGELENAREAVVAACSSCATVTASICITAKTLDQLPLTVRTAAALGADSVALNRFTPSGRGRSHAADLAVSRSSLNRALHDAGIAAAESGISAYLGIPVEPCKLGPTRLGGIRSTACVCGLEKWAVGPDGELRVCEQSPKNLGDLVAEGFETLSEKPEVAAFRAENRFGRCIECDDYSLCGGGCRFSRVAGED